MADATHPFPSPVYTNKPPVTEGTGSLPLAALADPSATYLQADIIAIVAALKAAGITS